MSAWVEMFLPPPPTPLLCIRWELRGEGITHIEMIKTVAVQWWINNNMRSDARQHKSGFGGAGRLIFHGWDHLRLGYQKESVIFSFFFSNLTAFRFTHFEIYWQQTPPPRRAGGGRTAGIWWPVCFRAQPLIIVSSHRWAVFTTIRLIIIRAVVFFISNDNILLFTPRRGPRIHGWSVSPLVSWRGPAGICRHNSLLNTTTLLGCCCQI